MDDDGEILLRSTHLLGYHPSPIRWYVLAVFSLLSLIQATIWSSWSPIAETAKCVFPTWNDSTISLLTNWGPITYLALVVPICWLLEKSLRYSMLLCVTLLTIGAVIRCIPLQYDSWDPINHDDVFISFAAHICGALNGVAGVVTTTAPPAISAIWFPVHERTTATGIGQVCAILALSISSLMGTAIVHDTPHQFNSSDSIRPSHQLLYNHTVTPEEKEEMWTEIKWLMWAQALPVFLLSLLTCLYFPNKSPSPPSRTAELPRLNIVRGMTKVIKNPNAWLISVVVGVPNAIVGGWVAMMGDFLPELCFNQECLSQEWVDILSIVCNIVAGVVAVLVARLTDILRGHIKKTLVSLLLFATIGFTLLSLVSLELISFPKMHQVQITIYGVLPLSTALIAANIPLCTELAIEICFPAAEVVVCGWITLWISILSSAFFWTFAVPGIGTKWLYYILPISTGLTIPLALLVKDEYRRTTIDAESRTPEGLSRAESIQDFGQLRITTT